MKRRSLALLRSAAIVTVISLTMRTNAAITSSGAATDFTDKLTLEGNYLGDLFAGETEEGDPGSGSIIITSNSASGNFASIGRLNGGNGTLSVSGNGLAIYNATSIGFNGIGRLEISGTAQVVSSGAFVGGSALLTGGSGTGTGTGTVVMTGGLWGGGTLGSEAGGVGTLTMSNGTLGTITVVNGMATISGSQSVVNGNVEAYNGGDFVIDGAQLIPEEGAPVSAEIRVGSAHGRQSVGTISGGAFVDLAFAEIGNPIFDDEATPAVGPRAVLNVSNSVVRVDEMRIGVQSLDGQIKQGVGEVNLRTALLEAGELFVGYTFRGELNVLDGGDVVADTAVVGDATLGDGIVTISGDGSSFRTLGDLTIGTEIGRGVVEVTDGGELISDQDTYVGRNPPVFGSSPFLTGEFSIENGSFTSLGNLHVGFGATGEMLVGQGGFVEASHVILGNDLDGQGTLTVDGTNARMITDTLLVGQAGRGRVIVSNGGLLESAQASIETLAELGSSAAVEGPGSRWFVQQSLRVGDKGNGELVVRDGGLVDPANLIIGAGTGVGLVTVENADSQLIMSGNLTVGSGTASGKGTLIIRDGGLASAMRAFVQRGQQTGAIFLDDGGSRFNITQDLNIGHNGDGQLFISGGAVINSGSVFVGAASANGPAGPGSRIELQGIGSELNIDGMLSVGRETAGTVMVKDGAALMSRPTRIGRPSPTGDGIAGHVLISNSGSWTADTIEIASTVPPSTLLIDSGGIVATGDLTIGVASANPSAEARLELTQTAGLLTAGSLNVDQSARGAVVIPMSAAVQVTSLNVGDDAHLTKNGGGVLISDGNSTFGTGSSTGFTDGRFIITGQAASIDAGATVNATHVRVDQIDLQGVLALRQSSNGDLHDNLGTSVFGGLTLAANAKLDIGNNGVVIRNAGSISLEMIRSALIAGRNAPVGGTANGKWDGASGIGSSVAAAMNVQSGSEGRTIGYALNKHLVSSYAEFMGQSVGPNDILVRYTVAADFDLNGRSDDNDVSIVGGFYNPAHNPNGPLGPRLFSQGDTNFDGIVNDTDVTVVSGFYRPTAQPVAPQFGGLLAVPEPSATLLALIGAGAVLPRRRPR